MIEKILIDFTRLLYEIPAVLLAIGIHEYFHAFVAVKMGDDTPLKMGMVNINPFPRLDLVGFLMFIWFNYGWTRDTPIDYRRFSSVWKSIFVSLAGIMGNIILGVGFLLFLFLKKPSPESFFYNFVGHSIVVNFNMALINFLPVPPLDGGKIVGLFIPQYLKFTFIGAIIIFFISLTDFSRFVQSLSYSILRVFI